MIRQREQSLHFTAPYCRAKEKNATGLLFLCVYLTASRSSMSAARLCLLSVEKCCIDQIFFSPLKAFTSHCRHFCPFFSSPAALLSHCFATALFTLFKILPLSSPLTISCPFSLFFALTNSLLPRFSAPQSPLLFPTLP